MNNYNNYYNNGYATAAQAESELSLSRYVSSVMLRVYGKMFLGLLVTATATALFYLYAVLNGVTLTPIFLIYTGSTIALTFGITSVTFGAMCAYGYFTKQDLSKMGAILFMALIGLIVCTIVNLFLHSSMMDWIISFAGVAIFVGLTAWDTQSIKRMVEVADPGQTGKIATLGALSLYLDFINLFIYLLRIFGGRD